MTLCKYLNSKSGFTALIFDDREHILFGSGSAMRFQGLGTILVGFDQIALSNLL